MGKKKARQKFQSTLPTRGSDAYGRQDEAQSKISIHAPHEGERHCCASARNTIGTFQSTLPTRGSDEHLSLLAAPKGGFQSTLPTRGSDFTNGLGYILADNISIHAPHEGERQSILHKPSCKHCISIHAPHEGERHTQYSVDMRVRYISIHAPHEGERPGRKGGQPRRP